MADIRTGASQRSILESLLFLIKSNCKLFSDDTFLFSVVHDIDTSENNLNYDLAKVSERAFLWKMRFKSDLTKQAPEIIFSKKKNCFYPPGCLS